MNNTSLEIGLNDRNSNYDNSNYFNVSYNYEFESLFGGFSYRDFAFIQFVESCLVIALGLPLTLGAIYGLYSQVRNGEVAPIYVINLLISDLIQFCCMIAEAAQPWDLTWLNSGYWIVFMAIYVYCLLVSVGFMVCIALERYLVIVHPLWYSFRRTIKTSVLICVLVWILPAVFGFISLFAGPKAVLIHIIFFLLPFPLLIFFLVATLKALSASISVPTEEKRRIAGMLILVLLIYTVLFLPTIILYVYFYDFIENVTANPQPGQIKKEDMGHVFLLIFLAPMFYKLSPLADLVLYILLRKGIIQQLSACVCRCRKESNEISAATVNDVNMSSVPSCHLMQKNMEGEGEKTEQEL